MSLINSEVLNKQKVIINTSPSKAMYSFPKTQRFKYSTTNNAPFGYNMPSVRDHRGTSLGYGNKLDLSKKQPGRTDSIYNIPREFDFNRSMGVPKYSFGLSRENCKIPKSKDEKNTPGPANYKTNKPFGSDGPKYTLSGRHKIIGEQLNMPGPGSYKHLSLNESGRYPVSTFNNSPKYGFGLDHSLRFKYDFNKNPGPGAYKNNIVINGQGIVYDSVYKTNLGKSISMKFNYPTGDNRTPGPGAYNFFSDFEGFNKWSMDNNNKNGIKAEDNKESQ